MEQWRSLRDIPWPVYIVIAAFALILGNGPQLLAPVRHDPFTGNQGKALEDRIIRLERERFQLSTDIEVMKNDVNHMSHDVNKIDMRTEQLMDLVEEHLIWQRSE